MALYIILLILILILVPILILFLFYILFPSIKKNQKDINEDPVIADDEKDYIKPIYEDYQPSINKAVVLCDCDKEFKCKREVFNKEHSCSMVNFFNGSGTDCKFACIGLGDCAKACPQKAIEIHNNTAVVTSLCIGCGTCVDICPKKIIKLIPKVTYDIKLCSSDDVEYTTCSTKQNVKKLEWNDKNHFKIWSYCYKMLRPLFNKKY